MTSQHGKQIFAIHILPNIVRSKDNQIMIFGQLIEYNMKTFFLKYHLRSMMKKIFPDPFLKKQNSPYL